MGIARGFLWSSVMLLLAIYLIAVLCINPLDNSSFPLLLFCDKFLKSISLFFRYLYTKFLLLKAMPCLMIAFFSSCIHNYQLLMLEEKKKDTRTKKQRMRADRLLKKKIE